MNKKQVDAEELLQGKVQLTKEGWDTLNKKITELHTPEKSYKVIAEFMRITENTLRRLRQEGEAYRTNLADLEGIFLIFQYGKSPQTIPPEEDVHYKYVPRTQKAEFVLPYELSCFQGRAEELRKLRGGFLEGKRRQAIVGLGGIGKTQLAAKYAMEYRKECKFVFWVHAETEEGLRIRYAEIALRLGLVKGKAPDQDTAAASVLRWLDENDGWLLVLDNADTPEILRGYLPSTARGHVLLTTRTRDLSEFHIPPAAPLQPLSARQALAFLVQRCGRAEASADERRAAIAIARELGCLPLALAYAAAYIARKAISFAEYLEPVIRKGRFQEVQQPECANRSAS